jgi:hypothetical protein
VAVLLVRIRSMTRRAANQQHEQKRWCYGY